MTIVSRASATTADGTERGCGRVQRAIWPRTAGSRVVDYVVDHLTVAGVSHVFGVDGANIEDLYDAAFFCPGITAVLAKHEFSAATMADGYSRATASLGVVAATSGGGALNLVAGLGESYASRVPVLALVGQVADHTGRARRLSGHQRPQRLAQRGGPVLGRFGVLPADRRPGPHPDRVARGGGSGPCRRPRGAAAAQGCSAGHRPHQRRVDPGRTTAPSRRSAADPAGAAGCAGAGDHHRR